ncbi:MAG: hypothetical protein EZS28_027504 [Streblomastix strix]|uniref:B30.2/SPRY domain-containing protein n=1 Tax=Streblomastix strix TaxID=222440 RepID=A0A5J4V2K5_9EUKA|nr:MAG: hypothetical protein EZS28_027504 [Streblomastix strix]
MSHNYLTKLKDKLTGKKESSESSLTLEEEIPFALTSTILNYIIPSKEDATENDDIIKHSDQNNQECTVLIEEKINEGVWRFEGVFSNHEYANFMIGIADESCVFGANKLPQDDGNHEKIVAFWNTGEISHRFKHIEGNSEFKCGQKVAIEVNMEAKTCHFFVDGVQQPKYVVGIPPSIRFWVNISWEGSSFEVLRLQILPKSYGKTGKGFRAYEYGKEWK